MTAAIKDLNELHKMEGGNFKTVLTAAMQRAVEIDLSTDAPPAAPLETSDRTPTTFADVKRLISPIRHIWKGRIAEGTLHMIAAEQEAGKTSVLLEVSRRYIERCPWFDGTPFEGEGGKILLLETEAGHGVDLGRMEDWDLPVDCFIVPFAAEDALEDVRLDEPAIREAITYWAHHPDVALIALDSLRGAHMGDENSSQMFEITRWLAGLARDTGKPVFATHHLRKKTIFDLGESVSLERMRGSGAITQPARIVWGIDIPDPNNPTRRRLSVIKNSFGDKLKPIGFTISDTGLVFGDAPEPPRQESQLDRACDLLRALLSQGPMKQADLETEAKGAGISWDTFKRAKDKLGVVARRDGRERCWKWALPTTQF